ncbi:MAG: magnesium/cobalt transporter CorA [Armatimonadota bacterium]
MIKTYLFTGTEAVPDVSLDNWQSLVEGDNKLLWVDIRSYDRKEICEIAKKFGLHSIAVESCLDHYRRPHLYEFKDHFYINLTALKSGGTNGVKGTELHVFAGCKFIITAYKDKQNSAIDQTILEYHETPELTERGPMHAVYALAEDLIETYFPAVEKLDDDADKLEDAMLDSANQYLLRRLFDLKRRTFELRKLLGPQRDIFNELGRRDFPFMEKEHLVYFQDAYNRMIRLFDMLDTIREILSGSLDIYLSVVSNRTNDIMKVLTVAATVFLVLSFITGFYGMNFTHIPWLDAPHAFRNMLLIMGGITIAMILWFRHKGWM